MLQEKNQKIEQLETRIKQLEAKQPPAQPAAQAQTNTPSPAVIASDKPKVVAGDNLEAPPGTTAAPTAAHSTIMSKIGDLGDEIAELKEAANEKGLDISGFFDVNAKTDNTTDQTFSVGSVELDLEYNYGENFAASSAVVLCGNSAGVNLAAPPPITCGGPVALGA